MVKPSMDSVYALGTLGDAACQSCLVSGFNSRMEQQWHLAHNSSASRHTLVRVAERDSPLAIISKSRFSLASSASARLRSSISVFIPHHLTTCPDASVNG